MDPVSRRLAAAAMGVVFGLSRDDELEKTRLDLERARMDLERARMEREDFRTASETLDLERCNAMDDLAVAKGLVYLANKNKGCRRTAKMLKEYMEDLNMDSEEEADVELAAVFDFNDRRMRRRPQNSE